MLSQAAIYALTPQGAALALRVAAAIEQSGSYKQPGGRIFLSAGLASVISDSCVTVPDTQVVFPQAADAHPVCANTQSAPPPFIQPPVSFPSPPVFFERINEQLAANFNRFSCHILICASGIALRSLAPLLESKDRDPAVLLLDQRGNFVISLLSGHLGGANRAARELAGIIGATPVITTATDCEDLPALDELAAQKNLRIENLTAVRTVNSALLRGEKPWLLDCENRLGLLGSEHEKFFSFLNIQTANTDIGKNPPKNQKTLKILPESSLVLEKIRNSSQTAVMVDPPEDFSLPDGISSCLILRSKKIWMGLGCKRGVPPEAMEQFASEALAANGLSWSKIAGIASIDIKSDEAAILELARHHRLPLRFFKAEELDTVPVPGQSERVRQATGTASVCEAAALLAASFASSNLSCNQEVTPDSNHSYNQGGAPDIASKPDASGNQGTQEAAGSPSGFAELSCLGKENGKNRLNGYLLLPKQKGPGITVALASAHACACPYDSSASSAGSPNTERGYFK